MISLVVASEAGRGYDEVQLEFGYPGNENGARKLFSHEVSAPSLYMPSEGNPLSVRFLTSTEQNPLVPLMFAPGADGSFTIRCNFDPDRFETVMLEDRLTHVIQNMNGKNSYFFQSSTTDETSRFVLHFGPDSAACNTELPAWIYTDGRQLIIDLAMVGKETETFIYDVTGRLLTQKTLQGSEQHQLSIHTPPQILIVQLVNPQGSICRKVFF